MGGKLSTSADGPGSSGPPCGREPRWCPAFVLDRRTPCTFFHQRPSLMMMMMMMNMNIIIILPSRKSRTHLHHHRRHPLRRRDADALRPTRPRTNPHLHPSTLVPVPRPRRPPILLHPAAGCHQPYDAWVVRRSRLSPAISVSSLSCSVGGGAYPFRSLLPFRSDRP